MSALEVRASLSLASLFALRMLGLFLILPVFAVHAIHLEGGDSHLMVGIALGAYGLTQGLLQIPFGMAADRFGRKRVIVAGLALFAAGSFVAAFSTSIAGVIAGRAIQGAGAISAAVMALAADLTREQHRTKAMAAIGGSIGASFALSLTAAPVLYRVIGMEGIFILTGVLALAGVWVTVSVVPEPAPESDPRRRDEAVSLGEVLRNPDLLRLNFGIFALHSMQMAIFVVIPLALVQDAGVPVGEHWKIYLAVVSGSFVLMLPAVFWGERRGAGKRVFLGAIVLMLAVQGASFALTRSLGGLLALLLLFFVSFNILEAMLPSLVTRFAPDGARATAIGVYNTTQALGLFAGGGIGGWLMENWGGQAVFVFGFVTVALWWVVAAPMRMPGQLATRAFALRVSADPVWLRERLVQLRGVREAEVSLERGVATLTYYPDNFDQQSVVKLLQGDS